MQYIVLYSRCNIEVCRKETDFEYEMVHHDGETYLRRESVYYYGAGVTEINYTPVHNFTTI